MIAGTMRVMTLLLAAALLLPHHAVQAAQDAPPPVEIPFATWLDALIAEARTKGFSEDLLKDTLVNLTPLPRVVERDRSQAELTLTLTRYFQSRITPAVIRLGREMAVEHRSLLARVEADFGVQSRYVLAIWGIESRYGRYTGSTPVFQALATLAWEPRRSDFFREQLFDALGMVSRGYIDAKSMTGSWAGAMGQAQFMPSSYLEYAVDFDGDGRRDIWRSTPDALASIASYLDGYGWNKDQTWGREVKITPAVRARVTDTIPMRAEGCSAMRTMSERRPLSDWRELGVRNVNGGPLPVSEIPAGLTTVGDRSFLLYPNYDSLLHYNCAHLYALSVAMLGDKLR